MKRTIERELYAILRYRGVVPARNFLLNSGYSGKQANEIILQKMRKRA